MIVYDKIPWISVERNCRKPVIVTEIIHYPSYVGCFLYIIAGNYFTAFIYIIKAGICIRNIRPHDKNLSVVVCCRNMAYYCTLQRGRIKRKKQNSNRPEISLQEN